MQRSKTDPYVSLIDRLEQTHQLSAEEFAALLSARSKELSEELFRRAAAVRKRIYGNRVFVRGLIEFTNYCKNDCYYCGIRRGNQRAQRYRLSDEEILSCCEQGYALGFRTFVLQGGEDPYYTREHICDLVRTIKRVYPDCALTLSIGEWEAEDYRAFREAGADRYLLRHETANAAHYESLHPKEMSVRHRQDSLWELKRLGFQVGAGFMVGSPGQTKEHLAEDLLFLHALQPQMVGIGPFIPQKDTPLGKEPAGTLEETLFLLGLIRLMLPNVLLPATTALGTIHPLGREMGIRAGANVVMPNLSPVGVRDKYLLYDNKICTGDEAAECRYCMERRMDAIGYQVVVDRGDYISDEMIRL